MRKALMFFIIACFFTFIALGQGVKVVALKQVRVAYAPVNYYINGVIDDRNDKNTIGTIGKDGLNLLGGAEAAIKNFIEKSVIQNRSAQAVSVRISGLDFAIKKHGAIWNADAEMTFAFYVNDLKTIELTSKGQKQTDGDPLDYVDEFIKQSVESELKRFDSWWGQSRNKIPTSPVAKVNVEIGETLDKPNTIVYSTDRPLTVDDFQGPPQNGGIEQAATLSGSGFATGAEVRNGQLVVSVVITPYFDKAGSWFKKGGHTKEVLAHEQAHFDINALNACELSARIRKTVFQKATYEQQLDDMLYESMEAVRKEQALFDSETDHGTIRDKELQWERKLKDRLATCGCY